MPQHVVEQRDASAKNRATQMKSKCRPTIAFALHSGEEAGRARTYCIRGHRNESASAATSTTAPPCHRTRVIISLSFGRSAVRVFPFQHAHAAASEACACVDKRMAFNYRTRIRRRRLRWRGGGGNDSFSRTPPHPYPDATLAIASVFGSEIWKGEAETLRHMHSLIASLPRFPMRVLLPWPCEQTRKKRNTVT